MLGIWLVDRVYSSAVHRHHGVTDALEWQSSVEPRAQVTVSVDFNGLGSCIRVLWQTVDYQAQASPSSRKAIMVFCIGVGVTSSIPMQAKSEARVLLDMVIRFPCIV